jgi:hypothetical protein
VHVPPAQLTTHPMRFTHPPPHTHTPANPPAQVLGLEAEPLVRELPLRDNLRLHVSCRTMSDYAEIGIWVDLLASFAASTTWHLLLTSQQAYLSSAIFTSLAAVQPHLCLIVPLKYHLHLCLIDLIDLGSAATPWVLTAGNPPGWQQHRFWAVLGPRTRVGYGRRSCRCAPHQ